MRVLFFFPLIVDTRLQVTSKNQLAKAFCNQGNFMTIFVGYKTDKLELDGFSKVVYVKINTLFSKLKLYWQSLISAIKDDFDVILIPDRMAVFLPLLRFLYLIFNKKTLLLSDIRTIPVDVPKGYKKYLIVGRFKLGIKLIEMFSDGLTVITPATREYIMPNLSRLKNKVGIWTSGVDLDVFKKDGDDYRQELNLIGKKVIIYHGVLSENRGIQNILFALKKLNENRNEFVFIILGDGNGKKELIDIAKKNKISESLIFLDPVKYSEVPKFLRTADCGILPFPDIDWWRVSSPLKLMEYIALNLKIVATDIVAHNYVKSIFTGIEIAKDNSPQILADAISKVFDRENSKFDFDLIEKNISWNAQANSLIKYINSLEK